MIAILLAAQLSAAAGLPAQVAPRAFANREAVVSPAVVCRNPGATQAAAAPSMLLRPQDRRAAVAHRLGDLPKANKEIAVARTFMGCAVPVDIRYAVEGDGRFASGR